MKLNRFIAVSLLFFLLSAYAPAHACGPFYWSTLDIHFYRIMPYGMEHFDPPQADLRKENCLLWKHQTRQILSTETIEEAVYLWTADDWRNIYVCQKTPNGKKNKFASHLLSSDNWEAIRIIYWSKCYEELRSAQLSPWYYSCSTFDSLSPLADSAICHIKGDYAMRYLFLAIKCLYTQHRDRECLKLWKKHSHQMKHDCIYNAAEGYVAGCMTRLGMTDRATAIFLKQGDLQSLIDMKRPVGETLFSIYRTSPNNAYLATMVQRILTYLHYVSYYNRYYDYNENDIMDGFMIGQHWISLTHKDLHTLLRLCDSAIANPKVQHNKGLWHYTAAAILDYQKQPMRALEYVEKADQDCPDRFVRHALQAMRFYLHARYDTIDKHYMQMLFDNMALMDKNLLSEYKRLKQNEIVTLLEEYTYGDPTKTIYSNDALKYILFGGDSAVCRRLVKAGHEVLTLQLANIGSYRLEQILARKSKQYRSPGVFSRYESDLFVLADGMSADTLCAYWNSITDPETEWTRFAATHSWNNKDYWNDIIGTHMLREQRFALATHYLAQCSKAFDISMNIHCFFKNDPFKMENVAPDYDSRHRYHFAKEMRRLENIINTTKDPNLKAECKIRLSIGLANAAGRDWPLLSYGWSAGDNEYDDYDESGTKTNSRNTSRKITELPYFHNYVGNTIRACSKNAEYYEDMAYQRALRLQKEAIALYTDPEAKARGYAMLWMVSRVMKELPNTKQGQYYARHCDQWRDYLRPAPLLPTPFRKVKHV